MVHNLLPLYGSNVQGGIYITTTAAHICISKQPPLYYTIYGPQAHYKEVSLYNLLKHSPPLSVPHFILNVNTPTPVVKLCTLPFIFSVSVSPASIFFAFSSLGFGGWTVRTSSTVDPTTIIFMPLTNLASLSVLSSFRRPERSGEERERGREGGRREGGRERGGRGWSGKEGS